MSKKETVWHKGPPPSIGWWPASAMRNEDVFRWWNGQVWSCAAFPEDSAGTAASWAEIPDGVPQNTIEWKHRPDDWPARSRT